MFVTRIIVVMYRYPAVSAGKTLTMLFAVAAAAGTAAVEVTDEDATPPPALVTKPTRLVRADKPLVLPTGAPACGNVMSKAGVSDRCRARK